MPENNPGPAGGLPFSTPDGKLQMDFSGRVPALAWKTGVEIRPQDGEAGISLGDAGRRPMGKQRKLRLRSRKRRRTLSLAGIFKPVGNR